MSLELLLSYLLACLVVAIVPGPVVSLIIANSLKSGARAGLLNVAGTQIGLGLMMLVLLLGLQAVMTFIGEWFTWIKLAGAAYLIWIGWKLIAGKQTETVGEIPRAAGGYVWQGTAVNLSNPKVLLFVGAFIPQFLEGGENIRQAALLMAIFMAVTAACDSVYAIAAGGMRATLSRQTCRWLTTGSGFILIAGGVWLAVLRR
jgi:threonine/homoserine/homoserine lactone efflux protein